MNNITISEIKSSLEKMINSYKTNAIHYKQELNVLKLNSNNNAKMAILENELYNIKICSSQIQHLYDVWFTAENK